MMAHGTTARAFLESHGISEATAAQYGTLTEGGFDISEAKFHAMLAAHSARYAATKVRCGGRYIAEPRPIELVENFAGAMARWAGAGFKTATREQYDSRMVICGHCPHWDGKARFGLGICRAPGCGCSRFKQWLASERCPLGKWPSV
jgi:hypothetical protein